MFVGEAKGKMNCGKTSTAAMAKVKKSKNSEVRPMMTPMVRSESLTR